MPLTLHDFEDAFVLKEGGQNTLSLAFDKSLSRWCLLRSSKHSTSDLEEEAKVYSKLEHSGLVPLWGLGSTDGRAWMIQPYLHGLDASQIPQVPIPVLLELSKQWLEALAYLHAKGILHKDLHPGNLLLSGSKAYLLDLGMYANQGLNGSLRYLAPESVHGEYSVQSEIYCFALCFLRLVWGYDPLQGDTLDELRLLWSKGFDLESLAPDLRSILSSCLDLDPANRPESIQELLEALCALERTWDDRFSVDVMQRADHILQASLEQSPMGISAKRRHLLAWLERFPQSEVAQDLLISWARLADETPTLQEPLVEPKLPIAKWIVWKLCFLAVVGLLVWWMWPSPKATVDLNELAQHNLLVKTTPSHTVRDSQNFVWIKVPDSISCESIVFEGRKLKEAKILSPKDGKHHFVCVTKTGEQIWDFFWNPQGQLNFNQLK